MFASTKFASLTEHEEEIRVRQASEAKSSSNIAMPGPVEVADHDTDGFVVQKNRRKTKLSPEVHAAKKAQEAKERDALLASGAAKKLQGVAGPPKQSNPAEKQQQEAALKRQLEKKAKRMAYLELKARNAADKVERDAKRDAARQRKEERDRKKAARKSEEAAWVAKHEQLSLLDFVKKEKKSQRAYL